jgi:hypothetical protein
MNNNNPPIVIQQPPNVMDAIAAGGVGVSIPTRSH